MENDNREKKDYRQQNVQKFYFNDEGQLVVESNKGVWVDGEQYVKMYGNFSCNAKTMGAIIAKLKGITVEVGDINTYINHNREYYDIRRYADILEEQSYCVLGVSEERIKEYEEKLAGKHYTNLSIDMAKQQNDNYKSEIDTFKKAYSHLRDKVISFNSLPWYKRWFKKINV